MSEWKVRPAVLADESAYVYADRQYICECKPTPHEVARANFAQNRRAEPIAAAYNSYGQAIAVKPTHWKPADPPKEAT